jgi:hypothetical protein
MEVTATNNPANPVAKRLQAADYVSMDSAVLKLAVPEIPGFYLYWHLGKNVSRAKNHGYTFVDPDEVEVVQTGIATGAGVNGSTDLGTRISVSAGASGDDEEERLYLMKLPIELHEKGMAQKTARNEEIAVQLRSGMAGAEGDPDRNKRYMKEGQKLFYPKASTR